MRTDEQIDGRTNDDYRRYVLYMNAYEKTVRGRDITVYLIDIKTVIECLKK